MSRCSYYVNRVPLNYQISSYIKYHRDKIKRTIENWIFYTTALNNFSLIIFFRSNSIIINLEMELLDFSLQQMQNRQSCSLFKEIVLSRATQRRFIEEVISVILIIIAFHGKITIFTVEIGIVARCSGSGSSQRTFRFNFAFPLSLWFGRSLLSNILLDHEKTGDFTDCWSFTKLYRFFF